MYVRKMLLRYSIFKIGSIHINYSKNIAIAIHQRCRVTGGAKRKIFIDCKICHGRNNHILDQGLIEVSALGTNISCEGSVSGENVSHNH